MTEADTADLFEAIVRGRKSTRAFLEQPVPRAAIHRIFETAQQAPSNCNTQPWRVAVASGTTLARLAEAFIERAKQRDFTMDFPFSGTYESIYQERQVEAAIRRYSAIGVSRDDEDARARADLENFRFHGAPHAAFLFLPDWAREREAADLGLYAQTLMLAISSHGLGSCPQTALGFFSDTVRSELNIGLEFRLLFGISFGYIDQKAPQSNPDFYTSRAPLADCVTFLE